MSIWEDQQVLEIIFYFEDGSKDMREYTGGGYDKNSIDNPFDRVLYRGDLGDYVKKAFLESHYRLGKLRDKLDKLVSLEVNYQSISSGSLYWSFRRISVDEGIKSVNVYSSDRDVIEESFMLHPSDFLPAACRIAEETFVQQKDIVDEPYSSRYSEAMIELTSEEKSAIYREKFKKAFLNTYGSYFYEGSDVEFTNKKRFVIVEYEYGKYEDSRGMKLAQRLTESGAKETKSFSSATDYLIVNTDHVPGSAYEMVKQEDGSYILKLGNNGKGKIDHAIEFQENGGKVRILSMDFVESLLGIPKEEPPAKEEQSSDEYASFGVTTFWGLMGAACQDDSYLGYMSDRHAAFANGTTRQIDNAFTFRMPQGFKDMPDDFGESTVALARYVPEDDDGEAVLRFEIGCIELVNEDDKKKFFDANGKWNLTSTKAKAVAKNLAASCGNSFFPVIWDPETSCKVVSSSKEFLVAVTAEDIGSEYASIAVVVCPEGLYYIFVDYSYYEYIHDIFKDEDTGLLEEEPLEIVYMFAKDFIRCIKPLETVSGDTQEQTTKEDSVEDDTIPDTSDMGMFTKDKFNIDGIEFGIPEGCIGIVDKENAHYGIVHVKGEPLDQGTVKVLMEETLDGEYDYEGVISAVKIFAAYDMECGSVDFTDDEVRCDFGGELYAEIAELENYIGLEEENAGKNYAYDVHPQIRYHSKNVLSCYWLDCHDDVEYYNYLLVCRMSNISTESGTYAIYCEFLLPHQNWKQELRYLLSQVTCNKKSVMDQKELNDDQHADVSTPVLKSMDTFQTAIVDNAWSVDVPEGCVYSTNPAEVANDIEGNPYALLLQSEQDYDFSNPYGPEISVAIRRLAVEGQIPDLREDDGENLIGNREINPMMQMTFGVSEEIVHTSELGVYTKKLCEEEYTVGSVFSRRVTIYVKGASALYDGQVRYYGNDGKEADRYIMNLIHSIGLASVSKVSEDVDLSEITGQKSKAPAQAETTTAPKKSKTPSKTQTKDVFYTVDRFTLKNIENDHSDVLILPKGLAYIALPYGFNEQTTTTLVIPEGYVGFNTAGVLYGDHITDVYFPDSFVLPENEYIGYKKRIHIRNNPTIERLVATSSGNHTIIKEDWQDRFEYPEVTPQNSNKIFGGSLEINETTVVSYNGDETIVTVPDGITVIGGHAFEDCVGVEEVILPQSVKIIEEFAFSRCANLKKVNLPDGLTDIYPHAFQYCFQLNNVTIPQGIKKLETGTFLKCLALDHITLPTTVTNIGYLTFGYTAFQEFPFHDKISVLGDSAFYGCPNLKKAVIPTKVKSLKWAMFRDCTSLEEVIVNEKLQYICGDVFLNCPKLQSIDIPVSVTKIGSKSTTGVYCDMRGEDEPLTLRIPHDSPVLAEAKSKKQYRVEVIGGETPKAVATEKPVSSPSVAPQSRQTAPKPQQSEPSVPQEITYKIRYDVNGGIGNIASQKKRQGESIKITNEIPTHEQHYQFLGWSTQYNAREAQYRPGEIYTEDRSAKFYAVWKTWTDMTYTPPQSQPAKKEGCYIATAVYGSYDAPEVMTLRRFRDEVLAKSCFGRWFIRIYYRLSPPVAEKLKNAKRINQFVKSILDKWVAKLNKK